MITNSLNKPEKRQKVMRECKLFAPQSLFQPIFAHFRDVLVGISDASSTLATVARFCVTIGKSGCATNATKSDRRRQLCLSLSNLSWPWACSPLSLLARSRKKLSWLSQSRSWKSPQRARCNTSVRSGAACSARPTLRALLSGGCPC